jgi:hypothetical protein
MMNAPSPGARQRELEACWSKFIERVLLIPSRLGQLCPHLAPGDLETIAAALHETLASLAPREAANGVTRPIPGPHRAPPDRQEESPS